MRYLEKMFLLPRLLLNKFVLLLVVGASIAYVAVDQPGWAIDPLRDVAEEALTRFGVGAVSLGLWALAIVVLLRRRPLALVRRWRLTLGSALVVVALQGLLAYFEAELPLIDRSSLGGELGDRLQRDGSVLGYAYVGGVLVVGLWFMAPSVAKGLLRRTGRGAGATAESAARTYGLAPLHRVVGALASSAYRRGAAALRGGGVAVREIRERRAAREGGSLGREVGDFLATQDSVSTPGASSAIDEELPPFLRPTASEAQKAAEATEEPRASSGAPVVPEQLPLEKPAARTPSEPTKANERPRQRAAPAAAWQLPGDSLLVAGAAGAQITEEHHATAGLIEETLAQHGVEVSVAEIRPGPAVTMFGLVPGWNRRLRPGARQRNDGEGAAEGADAVLEARNRVKVDSILAREKDLALALAAPSLRIEAPVPGESVVGVEVPNKFSATVTIRSVMESDEYSGMLDGDSLPVALGLASAGEPVAIDLLKMPHLLIAGATGSGKSVCINSVISSLLMHQPPSKVRLMLVDPKRVELTQYNGIPHLVTPVVVDPDRVVRLLRGAIQEMGRRYRLLEEAKVRNIQSYNRSSKATEEMPYFVICIDELADLMMTASFDVEQGICRLAQLGRATGIHLVVATQRPSVDVVTGLIKANFPSRIAFAVASQVDSRTILDTVGAERLLGRGDMLFLSPNAAKPRRVQGVLITEEETEALTEHWQKQPALPVPELELEKLAREAEMAAAVRDAESTEYDETDSLYDRAVQLAVANRQLSTSLLQRRLRIGYPRAARLMDQLEDEGVVAASAEPGKPREVLYRPDD